MVNLINRMKNQKIFLTLPLNEREKVIVRKGGVLSYVQEKGANSSNRVEEISDG